MSEGGRPLGSSGQIARVFQDSHLTPLLALVGLIAGVLVMIVTPKEEEPQIDVIIAFPGATAREVENLITNPGEQIQGVLQPRLVPRRPRRQPAGGQTAGHRRRADRHTDPVRPI